MRRRVWLDCDPGHDDAFAIVLALFNSQIELIGISTTAGNQTLQKTTLNAMRMLKLCGSAISVVRGAEAPLVAKPKTCPEIHGSTGLDFPVECDHTAKQFAALCLEAPSSEENGILHLRNVLMREVAPIDLIATGCLTNVALLIATFPEVKPKIRQVVFLGGAVGFPAGNVGAVAEFNVLLDPHACHMVFHSGLRVVQIPLSVSHTCCFTEEIASRLPAASRSLAAAVFRGFVQFFGATYKRVFGLDAPPLHDPLAIAFAIDDSLFETRFLNVEVEMGSSLCFGQTVADVDRITERPPNVHVATKVDVAKFWNLMIHACEQAVQKEERGKE